MIIVIIPVYTAFENLSIWQQKSILNTIEILGSLRIQLIGPKDLKENYIKRFNVPFHILDNHYFVNINSYNSLLLSLDFYKYYSDYSHMLIIHTDAWCFHSNIDEFKKFDYVGAPWKYPPLYLDSYEKFSKGLVGNGGLSLRNLDYVEKLLSMDSRLFSLNEFYRNLQIIPFRRKKIMRYIKKCLLFTLYFVFYNNIKYIRKFYFIINEDVFFGVIGPKHLKSIIPTPEKASLFPVETTTEFIKDSLNPNVFGCHSFEKRSNIFWKSRLQKM